MKNLRRYVIGGFIFTVILGTVAHFFYDWSNKNAIVGLFTPISESTWEHMKLIFFPSLIWSLLMYWKLKENYPKILCNMFIGILIGTFSIPVLFYGYTAILGFNLLPLDIAVFVIAALITFFVGYKQSAATHQFKYCNLIYVLTAGIAAAFIFYSAFQLFCK